MVQWLRLCAPNAGIPGSIPGQGTICHMPQLKILHAATKTHNSPPKSDNNYHPKNKYLIVLPWPSHCSKHLVCVNSGPSQQPQEEVLKE